MHAVVFDIDGTLLQSAAVDDALYRNAVLAVLGRVQFRPSLADYTHVSDSGILREILADNAVAEEPRIVDAIKAHFVAALESHVMANGPFPEIPGASRMLQQLQASTQHAVAFATGGWRASALLKLESAGLGDFGFPLATSDDAQDRVDIMQIALAGIGADFESITYYGDGPWDRDASRRLGWDFIAVGPELGGLEHYSDR